MKSTGQPRELIGIESFPFPVLPDQTEIWNCYPLPKLYGVFYSNPMASPEVAKAVFAQVAAVLPEQYEGIGTSARVKKVGQEDKGIAAWRKHCLDSPANITRVHIITQPLTPYLEWEIEVIYKDSLLLYEAEKVYTALRTKLLDVALPEGDFWIFDNTHVLQWSYANGTGKIVGGKTWNKKYDDITHFLQLREKLLAVAEPITDS